MAIVTIGLSHKTAPIEVRERLAFPENKLQDSLEKLHQYSDISEEVILSTCNRVEIYAKVDNYHRGIHSIKEFICHYHGLSYDGFERYIYCFNTDPAVQHLFRVSASLDSMIIGESQILGQVKEAYAAAKELNHTGPFLNQLFEKAFSVAKQIRTETGIAKNAVSVSFAAVELAKKIFGELKDRTAMLLGAGEMSELAARHLLSNGIKSIMVANRTFQRAVELAQELGGEPVKFEEFPNELKRADIVISSTGAPHAIIRKEMVQSVIKARKNRPMFFIDIAVPRDIEPSVNDLANVYLYDIDDLQNVIQSNLKEREREALKAEELIQKEVDNFVKWMNSLDVVPTIVLLRDKLERIREKEMEKAFAKIKNLSDLEKNTLETATRSIVNKILHDPMTSLKNESMNNNAADHIKLLKYLFRLEDKL